MQWFPTAYDRADAAEFILRNGSTELLTPPDSEQRVRRTRLVARPLGGLVVLMHYTHRNIYNRDIAKLEAMPTPFYQVHFSYHSPQGDSVTAMIDFDRNYAYVKRSSEYTSRQPHAPQAPDIWDQAMSALDVSLYVREAELAATIGQTIVVPLVPPVELEAPPVEQFQIAQAA